MKIKDIYIFEKFDLLYLADIFLGNKFKKFYF